MIGIGRLLFCGFAVLGFVQGAEGKPGHFNWLRLKTDSPYWNRHAEIDAAVVGHFRRFVPLDIAAAPHSLRAAKVEELSRFPLIYCQSLADLSSEEARNVAEYLRRGGFLFVDACQDGGVNALSALGTEWDRATAENMRRDPMK